MWKSRLSDALWKIMIGTPIGLVVIGLMVGAIVSALGVREISLAESLPIPLAGAFFGLVAYVFLIMILSSRPR